MDAPVVPVDLARESYQRIAEYGLTGRPIETFFDLNDYDEGRDPVSMQAWLS